jgi:hypothetical protein
MKLKVIGSSIDGNPSQFAASYVINDHIAIDAGSIGFMSVHAQKRIKHILISHSHLDQQCIRTWSGLCNGLRQTLRHGVFAGELL